VSVSTAIITTCKGRLHHLKQSIPTFLDSSADEIVVVDYGCPEDSGRWCKSLGDSRITVVPVLRDTARFNHPRAMNIGAAHTKAKLLAFFDCDILLDGKFLDDAKELIKERTARFVVPTWPLHGEQLVCGQVVMPTLAFYHVRGYDEQLVDYGMNDVDIYGRLQLMGWEEYRTCLHNLVNLPHSEAESVQFHECKSTSESVRRNIEYLARRRGKVNPLSFGQL